MKDNKYLFLSQSSKNSEQRKFFNYNKNELAKSYTINYYKYAYKLRQPSPLINVFCRFRPINELECLYSKEEAIKIKSSTSLLIKDKNSKKYSKEYKFNEIFEPNTHISSFYDKTCKNIINSLIQGYNGGIIIYGEKDSGRTYVLKEIIPQIIRQIYQNLYIFGNKDEVFKIEIAIYDIINEEIINLNEANNSKLVNNKNTSNIEYMNCMDEKAMENIINTALSNESKIENNDEAHLIIEIKISRYDKKKGIMIYGKLYLAKLNIIENNSINKNKIENNINQSINSLSQFIKDIINKKNYDYDEEIKNKNIHRKLRLTSILSDCFGGNTYTSLILTCSKSEYNINKTKQLFKLAKNAQKIKNNPIINVKVITNPNAFLNDFNKINHQKVVKISNKNNDLNNINYNFRYLSEEEDNNQNNDNKRLSFKKSFSKGENEKQSLIKNNSFSNNNNKKKNYLIDNYFKNNNYYHKEIEKYKNRIEELELRMKVKENQIIELNNELNDKKSNLILLSLEKEKILNNIEDKLKEKDKEILIMKNDINNEKKKMEINFYSQIKNSESIIRKIIEEKNQQNEIIKKYKDALDKYDIKMKELEAKYNKCIDENIQKNYDFELEINNYKMKISQLTNENFIKDSMINKLKGENQIIKAELSKIKENNKKNNEDIFIDIKNDTSSIINNKKEEYNLIDNYIQREINIINSNQNTEKLKTLETELNESKIIINEYKGKFDLINKELIDAKKLISNLQEEKENLLKENENLKNNMKEQKINNIENNSQDNNDIKNNE